MFRKLKTRLVLTNMGITSVVIIVVFSIIYIVSTQAAGKRPPIPENISFYSDEVQNVVSFTIREEKQAAAKDLLTMLIVSGISIEMLVFLISVVLAERAIRPVREAYEAQKVFIANASHEIKTPLAAISANLEAADIHNNRWIKYVEIETAKLATLNSELLTLARTDLMNETQSEMTDVAGLTNKTLASFEPRLKKVHLTRKITTDGKVRINVADYVQILGILMDNAVKYCDKKIRVSLNGRELVVENDGTVIAPEKLPYIFDRFYQVDKTAEGVGLGLSIAKSLAERNGWSLTAESGAVKADGTKAAATADVGVTKFMLKF